MTATLVALALLCGACNKEPGEGGRAELRGQLFEQRFNNLGNPMGPPYPLADERVFIIYGDGEFHDDNVRTSPDGRYRFPWLKRGDYTVYAISECGDFRGCNYAVMRKVTIGKRKEIVEVPDIIIENW
jgi:hypothetical protein